MRSTFWKSLALKAKPFSRPRLWLSCFGVALSVACSEPDPAQHILAPPGGPRYVLLACHSSMSATQCNMLNRAISFLKTHNDPMCRQFGSWAYDRNKAQRYEYDPYEQYIQSMSGGYYDGGAVWITDPGFAGVGGTTLAGLTVHEEYELWFPNDPLVENHAIEWEEFCGQGFVNNP